MKYLFIIIFILSSVRSFSQATDSLRRDSVTYLFGLTATGSLNQTNTSNAYLLNNAGRFTVRNNRLSLNFNASYIYGESNDVITNNDFFAAIDGDFNRNHSRFFFWVLANYTSSVSLKINSLFQAGGGIATNIINTDKTLLNLSDGIIYEFDDLYQGTEHDQYHTYRNSFRVKFRCMIYNRLVVETNNFLQNSLEYGDDYIIKSTTGLSFNLNKWLSINAHLVYNRFNRTGQENLLMTYGLKVETTYKKQRRK